MRAAILGVCFHDDLSQLAAVVRASTRITHTDPKAEWGALAIALAAAQAARGECSPSDFIDLLHASLPAGAGELIDLITAARDSAQRGDTTECFASECGFTRGVSGYVYQTVPVALHAWMRHPNDLRSGVLAAVRCGGDTDTVAAITGGIIGAGVGTAGVPQDWLDGLMEWPRSVRWIESLAQYLGTSRANQTQPKFHDAPFAAIALRNLLFTAVVLAHGFRRLAPPY
jgi:ADP-ribosylglycohydrolase